ncbi:MAG: alanine/ornithine racemase family PLP-dependent enzyme [Promethearchaeota archaeon]|nr:MAG: alanine/ornithine racemase family PLP-dependent enzyme [Candidatus Lokiarchaeota archaeon]
MPYLEINLKKIQHNAQLLKETLDLKNISIMGITKVTLGNPEIANTIIRAGITLLGDSRIDNIIRMRNAGVKAKFVLIRNPSLSEIPLVIRYADISLNTELTTIKKLSDESLQQKKTHGVILMVEMGDLREGIMPNELENVVAEVLKFKNIELLGIGTNLKCFSGVIPDEQNMSEFSEIAKKIQEKFNLKFQFISGGNSANYDWIMSTNKKGLINNLRIGTIILLGAGGVEEAPLPNYYQDAFTLVAEIIEIKKKPAYPKGTITKNAFGEPSIFLDKQPIENEVRIQALLNVGRQDVIEKKLIPKDDIKIMSATSDYIILDLKKNSRNFKLGDEIRFDLDYEALLHLMTSPYISKVFI